MGNRSKTSEKRPILIAIDPGCKGAASILEPDDPKPRIYRFHLTPEWIEFVTYVHSNRRKALSVLLERVWARQGIHSSGKLMEAYGLVRGILEGNAVDYKTLTPQQWHKVIALKFPDFSHLPEAKHYGERKRHIVTEAVKAWDGILPPKVCTQITSDSLMLLKALQKLQ